MKKTCYTLNQHGLIGEQTLLPGPSAPSNMDFK